MLARVCECVRAFIYFALRLVRRYNEYITQRKINKAKTIETSILTDGWNAVGRQLLCACSAYTHIHIHIHVCAYLRLPLYNNTMNWSLQFFCISLYTPHKVVFSPIYFTIQMICTYFIYAEPTLVGLFACLFVCKTKTKDCVYVCVSLSIRWSDSYKIRSNTLVQHALLMKCVEMKEKCRTLLLL